MSEADRTLRRPGRYGALLAAGLLGAVGAVLAAAGAFAPLSAGETRSPLPIAIGVVLLVLAVAFAVTQRVPSGRGPWPPAEQLAGAVALPVRPGHRAAGVVAALAVATVGVVTVVTAGSGGGRAVGVLVVVAGLAAAGWRWRSPVAIVLDPDGIALPGALRPRRVRWDDVDHVAMLDGWLPGLVLGVRGSRPEAVRLAGQAWPTAAVVDVVDHYRSARGRPDRPGLDSAASVERFRRP